MLTRFPTSPAAMGRKRSAHYKRDWINFTSCVPALRDWFFSEQESHVTNKSCVLLIQSRSNLGF